MSCKFWISRINAKHERVIKVLSELGGLLETVVQYRCRDDWTTFWIKAQGSETLMSSRGHGSFPALSLRLSNSLSASVETVDWNDQVGFSAYSLVDRNKCLRHITFWQGCFLEYSGVDLDEIIANGREHATDRNDLQNLEHDDTAPHYVFDKMTEHIDYFDLYDEVSGEDGDFSDCAVIQLPTVQLGLVDIEVCAANEQLYPWAALAGCLKI